MITSTTANNFEKDYKKVDVTDALKKAIEEEESKIEIEVVSAEKVKQRRGLNNFWGKFKDGIIDLFKEEEDRAL
jgi:cell division protein FtsA